jgi:HlyD family secretion protein
MTVIPAETSKIIGKIKLAFAGAGKVELDQSVNIKFTNYPYMEYGMVKGIIKNISSVPSQNYYIVNIDLPDGLLTNYKKLLNFSQGMSGTAEIITKDKRLLERIIDPIKSILKNRV